MKAIKFFALMGIAFAMTACGGSGNKEKEADTQAEEAAAFAEEQPVESGIFEATYFNINGKDARKGQFDGRVIFSLSPEQSAFLVYENGNRTKIKHLVMLDKGFSKADSVYTATDKNGAPVVVMPDSVYNVNYIVNSDTVTITFNPTPKTAFTPLEALSKIKDEAQK